MKPQEITKIAQLNDEFRRSFQGTVMTPGVMYLDDVLGLTKKVYDFDEFTEDNDPYGEHDFGMFVWKGEKVLWKIDYYDQSRLTGRFVEVFSLYFLCYLPLINVVRH